MRKEKMITRTIVTTNAEIMAFNLDTNDVITLNESYIGDLSDKDIEKQFAIDYSNSAKFLKLVNAEKSSKLYGITEKDFLENAVEIEKRWNKMTVWELYLVTLEDTNISIYDIDKKDCVYQGKNANIPLCWLKRDILNVTVCDNSELKISIW